MKDGSIIQEEKEVADAHPSGLRPFRRSDYIEKFKTLTDGLITKSESKKFLTLVQNLKNLNSKDLLSFRRRLQPSVMVQKVQVWIIFL